VPEPEPIFLYGAGGHARAVSEVIRRQGAYRVACVLDDHERGTAAGAPIRGGREQLAALAADGLTLGFVAIGNNADRELISTLAGGVGLTLATIIDPAAVVASDARIGSGTILMPMSFAGSASRIGDGVIVNTSATVDHDCVLEDFSHLSVGANLSGGCHMGRRSMVGIGATLGGAVRVGARAVIGAGAAVVGDVPDGVVAAGVPARRLSQSP